MKSFVDSLINVALSEVGTREVGHNGGACVREYQRATYLEPDDWAWCAAFVCWCIARAADAVPVRFHLPTTPKAFGFESWGMLNARLCYDLTVIPAGAIVIFEVSHVGIAVEDSKNRRVVTVEGNTNPEGSREGDGVYRRVRSFSLVRSFVTFDQ